MKSTTHAIPIRRIPGVLATGLGLGAIILVLIMFIVHGVGFTLGWLLGLNWPYPQNLQITSLWWLVLGVVIWITTFWLAWRRIQSAYRLFALFVGPFTATLVLFSWCVSLILYTFSIWAPTSSASGLRWLFDGPIMTGWRNLAAWLLFQLGVPGAEHPIHFVDGSSISHVHGTVIVLGLLNEAMLAALLATCLVLGVGAALGHVHVRRRAA